MNTSYEVSKAKVLAIRPKSNKGKKYKRIRRRGKKITPRKLMNAIPGSGGIKTEIGRRLGCTHEAVRQALVRPGFEDCLEAFEIEKNSLSDEAESAIYRAVKQRYDMNLATKNARWYLSMKSPDKPGYEKTRTVKLEGGMTAIRLEQSSIFDLSSLNLPLEIRKTLLESIETLEKNNGIEPKETPIKLKRIKKKKRKK